MRGVDVSSKDFWARCNVIRDVMCCSWRKAVSTAIREYESNGVTVFRTSRDGHEHSVVKDGDK